MGNTTGGLPWPEPSAPVRDGAVAIRNLAESVDTRYGSKKKHYINWDGNTDVNGLFSIAVPTTSVIYGCLVQERNTGNDANMNPIYIRCYNIDQASHRLNCRAFLLNPWGVVSSGAVSVSTICWTDT